MTIADSVTEALRTVIDPEIGVNIVDLGLVYGVDLTEGDLVVRMTMTTPACPLSEFLEDAAVRAIRASNPDLRAVRVEWVWEPPWSPARMTETVRRELGWND